MTVNDSIERLSQEARAEYEGYLSEVDSRPGVGGLSGANELEDRAARAADSSRTRRRRVFGVFWQDGETGRGRWCLLTSERRARRVGRHYRGVVSAMGWEAARGPWDAPTFRACSDLVADYTEAGEAF